MKDVNWSMIITHIIKVVNIDKAILNAAFMYWFFIQRALQFASQSPTHTHSIFYAYH